MENDSSVQSNSMSCKYCGKKYKTRTWLNKHLETHQVDNSNGAAASQAVTASDSPLHCGQIHNHVPPNAELHHGDRVLSKSEELSIKSRLTISFTKEAVWRDHDEKLSTILASQMGVITKGNAVQQLNTFDEIVYNYFEPIYPPKQFSKSVSSNKETSFKSKLRKKKRELKKKLRLAKQVGDSTLTHAVARGLRSILKLIQEVSKNDEKRKDQLKKGEENAEFDKNPFLFAKKIFKPQPGKINITKEQAETFYKDLYEDVRRADVYIGGGKFIYPQPSVACAVNAPTKSELQMILKKKSNGSAPGPNGIPYILYKKCPVLVSYLYKFFTIFWTSTIIPPAFSEAVVVLIPKKDVCTDPKDTRPIALTNTHSKIFFSAMSKRLTKFMEANHYTNRSIQKGFCEGIGGCLEHNELLAAALEDSRLNERQIVVCWLDLKNAFGSIKHQLIQFALEAFHVPLDIRRLIFVHYNQLVFSISSQNWRSNVLALGIGLFQGCCLSPTLFKAVFSLLENELMNSKLKGYKFKSNKVTPPLLTFADDLTLVSSRLSVVTSLLRQVEEFCDWTHCLQMKPSKCVCLALTRKGSKFKEYDPQLSVHEQKIETISEGNPFKFLGRHFDFKGRDAGIMATRNLFETLLKKIDNLSIMGPKKAWIYHHVLFGHLSWAFLIYEFPTSVLQEFEREATRLLKKWFLLSRGADPSILYRPCKSFGLGIANVSTRYKQLRCVKHCMLKDSGDNLVNDLSASKDLKELESRAVFDHRFLRGGSVGRSGLGWSREKESKRDAMKRLVMEDFVHDREVHAMSLQMQNDWVCVGDYCIPPRLAWKTIMYDWSPSLLKFYLNAFQYTLPDPSNLRRWGKVTEDSGCQLCGMIPCTARHILTGCKKALDEGRYTYRHDKVLKIVREAISHSIACAQRSVNIQSPMVFIKAGEKHKVKRSSAPGSSCLSRAKDWVIIMDIGNKHYVFPAELAVTSLCPDILVYSLSSKQVLLVELTVPWEENIPNQHLTKTRKYEELVLGLRNRGFKVNFFGIEVGARGLPGNSLHFFLKNLGLTRKQRSTYMDRMTKAAAEGSFYLWINRGLDWRGCEGSVEAS